MTQKVSDEKLGEFARKQNDWFRRVQGGFLDPDEVAKAVQQIIDRSQKFQRDMQKEDWELIEDVGETNLLSVNQLELVSFLFSGEGFITGEELVQRAKKMHTNLGQRQAEYLLDHQDQIPGEWRQYYLIFPGTIWRSHHGNPFVPYLDFDRLRGRWVLNFRWLNRGFGVSSRLLRPRE